MENKESNTSAFANRKVTKLAKRSRAIQWRAIDKRDEKTILKGLKAFRPLYLIAQDIGVSRWTLSRYLRDEMNLDYKDMRESMLDIAENKLLANIIDGNQNAIQFFLDRQGRSRGYGEKQQLDRQDVPTINIGTIQIKKDDLPTPTITETKKETLDAEIVEDEQQQ